MLKTTPFHARTAPLMLGQTWRRWSGYGVASTYDWLHDREYAAIRNAAALLDVSPLTSTASRVAMPAACSIAWSRATSPSCRVGQVMLYRAGATRTARSSTTAPSAGWKRDLYRLTSAEPSFRFLHQNAFGLDVRDRGDYRGLGALALQGPLSRAVLNQRGRDRPSMRSSISASCPDRIAGVDIEISRTGYTGDLGYEIWVPAARRIARMGRAHARRRRLRPHSGRHLGAGRGAHRSRPGHGGRGLPLRPSRDDRRARSPRRSSSRSTGR